MAWHRSMPPDTHDKQFRAINHRGQRWVPCHWTTAQRPHQRQTSSLRGACTSTKGRFLPGKARPCETWQHSLCVGLNVRLSSSSDCHLGGHNRATCQRKRLWAFGRNLNRPCSMFREEGIPTKPSTATRNHVPVRRDARPIFVLHPAISRRLPATQDATGTRTVSRRTVPSTTQYDSFHRTRKPPLLRPCRSSRTKTARCCSVRRPASAHWPAV